MKKFGYLSWVLLWICSAGLAKPAERIVALSPHAVEMLYAIGAGDRIVGTVEYADYPAEALTIPRIGNFSGIQIERLVELQPDLIVAWKSGNQQSDLQKIESLGFRVFYSQPQNLAQIADELIALGTLTGLESSALQQANAFHIDYTKIKKQYLNNRPVKVFYQLWHDPFRTIGPNSWVDSMIADCQGQNLFNDAGTDYPVVTLESVVVKNPEVIIIPHHSGDLAAKKAIWQNWKSIEAVKNQRVFDLDADLLLRTTPRALIGLEQMCAAIDKARQ